MNRTWNERDEQQVTQFKRVVEGYLLSIVCICGLIGNGLTCVILASRFMRSSITNIYILILSGISSFVLFGFLLTHGIRWSFAAEDFYQFIFTRTYPIHITCILIEIYLTAAVAVDRFLLICFPLSSRHWRSRSRAITIIVLISIFCIVYCLPFWFEFNIIQRNHKKHIVLSSFGSNRWFRLLMRQYLYFIFVLLLPLSTIIFCKALILRQLYSIRKRKQTLRVSARQGRSSNGVNFLLLSIVLLFLLTQFPYFIFNVLYTWFGSDFLLNILARKYLAVNNLLSVINASSTFLLYAIFDEKFREVATYILLCRPSPRNSIARHVATRRVVKTNFVRYNHSLEIHTLALERFISQNQ